MDGSVLSAAMTISEMAFTGYVSVVQAVANDVNAISLGGKGHG